MNTVFKGTPAPWYPINYAGNINIQREPFYETNADLLSEEDFKDLAIYNAQLAATAPELLSALQTLIGYCEENPSRPGNWWSKQLPTDEDLNKAKSIIHKALNPEQ